MTGGEADGPFPILRRGKKYRHLNLFFGAVSILDYIASNDKMIGE
jgi:hypothetical protein